jgi:nucleotide-binding universal stress UspA family protein
MKTILIPVDLIGETDNVLKYTAEFAGELKVHHIILLKSYYVSVYEQILPTPDFIQVSNDEVASHRQTLENELTALGKRMLKDCCEDIKVETVFSSLPLLRAVHNTLVEKEVNLVVVGSDSTTHEPGSYMGEQIIGIAKTSPVPVMVVPHNVSFQKIEEVLVPCDFSAISRLSALQGFHSRQRWVHPHLMLLNVDPKNKHADTTDQQVSQNLKEMLEGYQYDVYHSHDKETVHGILSFARQHQVQMIIALPGKYSFFYNLTHKSITHAIALNAARPVLILK